MRRAGEELGGYVLVREIGSGGMGTVYEAIDADRRHVALKLLHPHVGADPVARERLRREVATLHRVRHTGVARVLDAEADSDEAFVVTELVDGQTLEESVREHGTFQPDELANLAQGLADGLRAIHAAGVVHRDVKPSNVMLTDDGPVLIDFGISQIVDDTRHTMTGMVTGTPGYIDPQVVGGGSPSQEGDWWAWAAVLVFAVTGRAPFGRGPMPAVLARVTTGEVDVTGLEPGLGRAFEAALRPRLAERSRPEELLAVLHSRADGTPPAAPTAVVPLPGSGGGPTTVVEPPRATPAAPATRVLPTVAPSSSPGAPPGPPPPPPPTAPVRLPFAPATGGAGPAPPPSPTPTAAPTRANPYAPPVRAPWQPRGAAVQPASVQPASAPPATAAPWRGPGHPPVPRPGQSVAGPAPGVGAPGAGPAAGYLPELPAWARPAPARPGVAAGLGAVLVGLAMPWPGLVAIVAATAVVLAATVGSAARATRARRLRAGRRRSDVTVAVLSSPWHALRGTLAVAVSLLAGLLAGLAAWWVTWTLLAGPTVAVDATTAGTKALVTGGVVALVLVVTWLAPTSGLAREGLWTAGALVVRSPGTARVVALAGLGVGLLAAVLTLAGGQVPDWTPFAVPPYG